MPVIKVKVIPGAKCEKIEKLPGQLKVYVNQPAREGKANRRLIEILSGYFKVRKRCIRILQGQKTREKTIEVSREP